MNRTLAENGAAVAIAGCVGVAKGALETVGMETLAGTLGSTVTTFASNCAPMVTTAGWAGGIISGTSSATVGILTAASPVISVVLPIAAIAGSAYGVVKIIEWLAEE